MKTQPEALRLADCLETEKVGAILGDSAAAEMRRLHESNQELLAALKGLYHPQPSVEAFTKALAAIKKAERTTT